jgi:putative colanic acid biosynthesis acetyltransferase WcaF
MIIAKDNAAVGPSFSLRNRVLRQVWNWVWLLLFRPSPRPAHAWRAFLLTLFGARLGRHVHIYPAVKIWAPWQLEVHDGVGIADGVTLYNIERIEIGAHCVVSQGSHLCTGSHDYNSPNFQLIASPIVLAPYVWLCAETFVSPGVTLPEGCVIAPRSVVTKPLPTSWTVYAGSPARPVGKRKPQAYHAM